MKLVGMVALLLLASACNCESSKGVVVASAIDLPVNWALHSDSNGRFSLLVSKFERDKGSVWLCRSRAERSNESPDFVQVDCFLDLKARNSFGGWSRFLVNGEAYVVVPVQNTVNDLALTLYSDKNAVVTDLLKSCVSLPTARAAAGANEELVVALGFGCRLDCTDGLYVLRSNGTGQGECFREVREVTGVSDASPHFLEWVWGGKSPPGARTWSLTPGEPARELGTLAFGDDEAVLQVGRYGNEPRFFAYLDRDGRRTFRDDIVVAPDGSLSRAPSRLAEVTDIFRILDGTSSPDMSSTFLLLQSESGGGTLAMVRIDVRENRLVWRRPLKAGFNRRMERMAANGSGVGYWASQGVTDSRNGDIWFEFLEN